MFVIVAVGPVGAVGNAQRFPSGCGNRGSDFRRCGSFHGPGGEPPSARLLVGSTAGGETAPSYLAAAACGLAEPVRSGAIGIPEMNLRLDVTGTGSCSGDLPWASVAPAAGVTAPSATSSPTVTLNSAGLVPGGVYTGGLCVQSNDPDSPTVLVPLTLTVDDILFADGFETGNTLLWSVTVP